MNKNGLTSINVENALETIWENCNRNDETIPAYYVLEEFVKTVKEGVMDKNVPVLLKKRKEQICGY